MNDGWDKREFEMHQPSGIFFFILYFDRIKRVLCLRMETPGVAGKGDGGQGQTGARDASRLEP